MQFAGFFLHGAGDEHEISSSCCLYTGLGLKFFLDGSFKN
jgi:hypothetical protein